MHNIVTRISTFSSFVSTLASILLGLITLSSFNFKNEIKTANVNLKDIKVTHGKYGSQFLDSYLKTPSDYVLAKMDIKADFTELFHWNTKQIFSYVVIDYENANYTTNKVVVWDRIIRNKKFAKVSLKNQRLKYALTDISPSITDNHIKATIHWEVVPWVGFFLPGKAEKSFGPFYLEPKRKPKKRKLAEEKTDRIKNSYNME